MSTTTLPGNATELQPAPPETIHSCPNCSHWLPDGTLSCPDCDTLTYGRYLGEVASSAQVLEGEGKWAEARERWEGALSWMPADAKQAEAIQGHIAAMQGKLDAEDAQKKRWTKRLGPFAPIALFLLKAKSAFFLLFKLKFLLGLMTFFALYWAIFGWKFALGFTVIIFIHEMGHFVAVKRRGLKADLPVFFPGLGAYVRWYSQGVSLPDLASIALDGPIFGIAASLGCLGIWFGTRADIWLVLANVGAWVNLFNLLPLLGLDGAQATYALARGQRALVAATCVVFFGLTVISNPPGGDNIQWLLLIVGLGMGWRAWNRDAPEKGDTRTFVTFQVLVIALGIMTYRTGAVLNALQSGWHR